MAITTIEPTYPQIGESSQTQEAPEVQSLPSYTSHCYYQPNGVSQYDIVFHTVRDS